MFTLQPLLLFSSQRNVEPDDLRFLPENTQIWKITLAKLLECTLVKSDEIVDQDLLTYALTLILLSLFSLLLLSLITFVRIEAVSFET